MSLFEQSERANLDRAKPLAARMRPRNLDEFIGQEHILGEDKLLRRLLKADRLGSILLFGPPGVGKTTLARILADQTSRRFRQLSAIMHGVKDLRAVLAEARDNLAVGEGGTLLFIDEIHRFNKAQQDAMLADVEDGVVTLVGATTSNPYFAVNNALVSRSQVFQFEPLTLDDITELVMRAINDSQRGFGDMQIEVEQNAIEYLSKVCDGDGRRALSILETAVLSTDAPVFLTSELMREATSHRSIQYDGTGDEHYDCASALIKSIRGSDPDAAVYWLARMLAGGEEIRFLCRRLIILASEDIGNADPHALPLTVACSAACEQIGLPECQLTLSQTVTYLAAAPKSNSATVAIGRAKSDIKNGRVLPVPRHLRDAHYGGAKELGHGKDYQYSHNHPDGYVEQDYLGVETTYYEPTDRGYEKTIREHLDRLKNRKPTTDKH